MSQIVTLTLNPALDVSTATDEVRPGPKLRCDPPRLDPGGGGVNVSRAIRILGGTSRAVVALGGATGAQLRSLLEAEGIAVTALETAGDTRQSLAVMDRATGLQFRFVLPGPVWRGDDFRRALDTLRRSVAPTDVVVLSGSMPPGLPEGGNQRVAATVAEAGGRLVVDTSGIALSDYLERRAPVWLIRLDGAEAEGRAGRPLVTAADTASFAGSLAVQSGAHAVIVARGADGSVLAGPECGLWHARAPATPVRSAVGAGDSFVGALVLALGRDAPLPDALRLGAAAAAAAVMTDATELCRREDVESLAEATTLTPL